MHFKSDEQFVIQSNWHLFDKVFGCIITLSFKHARKHQQTSEHVGAEFRHNHLQSNLIAERFDDSCIEKGMLIVVVRGELHANYKVFQITATKVYDSSLDVKFDELNSHWHVTVLNPRTVVADPDFNGVTGCVRQLYIEPWR